MSTFACFSRINGCRMNLMPIQKRKPAFFFFAKIKYSFFTHLFPLFFFLNLNLFFYSFLFFHRLQKTLQITRVLFFRFGQKERSTPGFCRSVLRVGSNTHFSVGVSCTLVCSFFSRDNHSFFSWILNFKICVRNKKK